MYVIGDVHGCYKTLMALVEKLPKDEQIIFVGDLIDRGPGSREVVQWVIDNPTKCRSVKGNHEIMLVNARKKPNISNVILWTQNGGSEALDSYFPETQTRSVYDGLDDDARVGALRQSRRRIDIPKEHLEFFESLPLYLEEGKLFVSHTGLNDNIPWDNFLKLQDSTWYRGNPGRLPDNRFHVFGHTPTPQVEMSDFYANIDTGACFAGSIDFGNLTALHYPTMDITQQENIDFPAR